ncbi:hypothetical protein [Defluviimonas sp. SAOS-178_SWC]|uniref:hypothetical protein n=1 Tax=Defluviimonas sp. SAOS-178_SWC TaxID=3121287 RepID=UPI0032221016
MTYTELMGDGASRAVGVLTLGSQLLEALQCVRLPGHLFDGRLPYHNRVMPDCAKVANRLNVMSRV